jgi:hypothetical protein
LIDNASTPDGVEIMPSSPVCTHLDLCAIRLPETGR